MLSAYPSSTLCEFIVLKQSLFSSPLCRWCPLSSRSRTGGRQLSPEHFKLAPLHWNWCMIMIFWAYLLVNWWHFLLVFEDLAILFVSIFRSNDLITAFSSSSVSGVIFFLGNLLMLKLAAKRFPSFPSSQQLNLKSSSLRPSACWGCLPLINFGSRVVVPIVQGGERDWKKGIQRN